MKWCGGMEQNGKVASSVILPDMHVPLYEPLVCAIYKLICETGLCYWLLLLNFLASKDEVYARVITDDLTTQSYFWRPLLGQNGTVRSNNNIVAISVVNFSS